MAPPEAGARRDTIRRMPTEFAVQTQGLTRDFGDFRAVNGIDLAVPAGSLYGFRPQSIEFYYAVGLNIRMLLVRNLALAPLKPSGNTGPGGRSYSCCPLTGTAIQESIRRYCIGETRPEVIS